MELSVSVITCPTYVPTPCIYQGEQVGASVRAIHTFQGSTGETVTMHRVVPGDGDEGVGGNHTPELGFGALPDYYHVIRFDMTEIDGITNNEPMGWANHVVESAKGGDGIGTFTLRSLTHQGAKQGDYSVTFEVRPMALPDVRPASIEVSDLPNSSKKRLCAAVQNAGIADAGPFMVAFYLNGADSEGGRPVIASLASGQATTACVTTAVPTTGEYDIRVALDEPRRLGESNEANNAMIQIQKNPGQQAAPEATPTPKTPAEKQTPSDAPDEADAMQADLTVGAIKVNGQQPDGKDDCKAGKSSVTVIVKNTGDATTKSSTVRLVLDGDKGDALEQSVGAIEAGKEREARFNDVGLSRGKHKLTASVDAKGAIVESDEDNNDETVTVTCGDN
jgi:hypothetical protein